MSDEQGTSLATAAANSQGAEGGQGEATGTGPAGDTQQQDGKQPEGQAQGEGQQQQQASAEGEAQGAPESYEFQAPENTFFDSQVLDAYGEVARELNLPQESAQKVIDKVAPVLASRQAEAVKAVRAEWVQTTKTDAEIGGDHFQATEANVARAMKAFGTPALAALLDQSGLGDHPEVVRVLARAGKAISEDGFVPGGKRSTADETPAKRLFPNMA